MEREGGRGREGVGIEGGWVEREGGCGWREREGVGGERGRVWVEREGGCGWREREGVGGERGRVWVEREGGCGWREREGVGGEGRCGLGSNARSLLDYLNSTFHCVHIDIGVPSIGSPLTITLRPSRDAAGVFAFSGSFVVVVEGTSATITIVRGGGSQGNASVSWFLVEQTGDLTPTSGTVTFSPGQTSTRFTIAAVDDMVSSALYLELLDASNCYTLSPLSNCH